MDYIEAIPTLYDGVQYRSRLEARFAEWLTNQDVDFEYQPIREWGQTGYQADFLVPDLDLYIEVKPKAFLPELSMFLWDIDVTNCIWICVDQIRRGQWSILRANPNFLSQVIFPREANTFTIIKDSPEIYFIRLQAAYVDLWPQI